MRSRLYTILDSLEEKGTETDTQGNSSNECSPDHQKDTNLTENCSYDLESCVMGMQNSQEDFSAEFNLVTSDSGQNPADSNFNWDNELELWTTDFSLITDSFFA